MPVSDWTSPEFEHRSGVCFDVADGLDTGSKTLSWLVWLQLLSDLELEHTWMDEIQFHEVSITGALF